MNSQTFDNKQAGDRNVQVRLDRAMASSSWSDWFSGAQVHHLITGKSDHLPILLEFERETGPGQQGRIARYEIMWERESSLTDEIYSAWSSETTVQHLGDIAHNLRGVMKSLQSWSKEKFGAVTRELEQLRNKLEYLGTLSQGTTDE
jgi:hypothetical protein